MDNRILHSSDHFDYPVSWLLHHLYTDCMRAISRRLTYSMGNPPPYQIILLQKILMNWSVQLAEMNHSSDTRQRNSCLNGLCNKISEPSAKKEAATVELEYHFPVQAAAAFFIVQIRVEMTWIWKKCAQVRFPLIAVKADQKKFHFCVFHSSFNSKKL